MNARKGGKMTKSTAVNVLTLALTVALIAGGCLGGGDPTPTPRTTDYPSEAPVTGVNGSIVVPGAIIDCSTFTCTTLPVPEGPPEASEPLMFPPGGD